MRHLIPLTALSAVTLVLMSSGATSAPTASAAVPHDFCQRTAYRAQAAARAEAREEFHIAIGNCLNISDQEERDECVLEAFDDYFEAIEESEDQFDARMDLCEILVDDGPYDPEIDPDDFSTVVDNPYYPIVPGTTLVYEKVTDEGTETIVIEHLHETRMIMGVECVAVRDTGSFDGEVEEDTIDYFAQDDDGNVWYFGEISKNYEDGYLTDLDGSWFAGEDGAKPGIVMHANRVVGETYRQEWFLSEAEDVATIVALNAVANVPYDDFTNCVQTYDFTPLEADAQEHKYYASGVGVVLEVDLESDERLELISVTLN